MAESVRGRIVWYELLTTDMTAAEKFYTTVVGWTVAPFDGAPEPYSMFMRDAQTPTGGVMNIPQGERFPPHWAMYVGVDRLEDAVTQIERLGGAAVTPVIEVPGVGRMRMMHDPQNAKFYVYEPAGEQPPDGPRQLGDVSWHELMTTDAEAALKFYSQMFGWQQSTAMDMGPMGKYYIFKGNSYDLGGMMNKPPEMAQVPPHWGIYFRVPDVEAATERVTSNGGKVLNGPMDVPGGSRVVNCQDPQGAHFSLHARQP